MTEGRKQKRVVFLISAGLVLATLVAYEPIRHNEFVNYDDDTYITDNLHVKGGITQQSVIWAFTKPYRANWHPLTWLSHMLDCEIYGLNPLGHHITNVLIHIASSLLLFLLLSRMTRAVWPSAFVAAVFALHPVHVGSVAWAAERKDMLSGLFWMLTMLAYVRYAERPNFRRYSLVLLAFVMGLMSKPMLVTLPFVLILLDWWPLERVAWRNDKQIVSASHRTRPTNRKVSVWHIIVEKIPLFVLSGILSVVTFAVQRHGGTVPTLAMIPLDLRFTNTFISYIRYIGKTIWPSRLAVFYPFPRELSPAIVVICVLLVVLLSIFSIYIGRRRKYAAVGWLWYVGTLVPVIGLVQVGSQSIADRYMYLPMVGLLIIAGWAVKDLVASRPRWRIVAAVSAVALLSSAVILTRTQLRHWQNDMTLFGHALKVTENNSLAEFNYGCDLYGAGRFDEAEPHFRNAIRISPALDDARTYLGEVLLIQGKLNEAVACFNELLAHRQDSAEAYYHLAVALNRQKKYDEAIKHFAKTLELDPKYPDAHNKMGTVLAAAGRFDEAIVHFNEALRIDPNQAEMYANIGAAYNKSGRYDQAIQNWTRAIEINPNSVGVLNNLAWLLASADDVSAQDANRAIELAERACEMTGHKKAGLLDTLAAAYAAGGRFDDAIKTADQALSIAKAAGQEEIVREVQSRMEFYRAGQRYIKK